MYRLFKKYGKQILAVFAAVLMVAFILPTSARYGGGHNPVIGTLDGEKITQQDLQQARMSWDVLMHTHIKDNPRAVLAMALPQSAIAEIQNRPQLFLLLLKEAQRMGITVGADQLNDWLTNAVDLASLDDEHASNVKHALVDLLLINNAFHRAASTVKISEPMVQHTLAEERQSIVVNLVEFNAVKYAGKVAAPTTQALAAQFEKYGDVIKGAPDPEKNPFGFGYKYPNRLKLQYIAIARGAVRKSVETSPPPGTDPDEKDIAYAWEKEARKYYIQHPDQFPATQPASQPSDSFSLGSGGVKARATTRPFEQARQDVIDHIVGPETDRRVAQILDRINSTLASDYIAYEKAAAARPAPSSQPGASSQSAATEAVSSLGVPYDSFEYLQKLAAQIQSQFKILPTVVSINDRFLTAEDLTKLPGIGQASGGSEVGDLSGYLMSHVFAFVAPEHRDDSSTLKRFEPAKPLVDQADTTYIARVTEAQAAHKPATLAEVEPAVRADVLSSEAYALAKADALKLYDDAKNSSLKSVGGAAVMTAGPMLNQPGPIPGYPITGDAAERFIAEAFKLVSTATSRPDAKPMKLIELPPDGKAIVAQLQDVNALYNTATLASETAQLRMMMNSQFAQMFGQKWFNYQMVAQRLHYVPDTSAQKEETSEPNNQPPIPPPLL
jgi:hypothetical protein